MPCSSLRHGRRGWDLTYLPDNFFSDVEGVLAALLHKMQGISEIDGCKFAYENAVVPLRGVEGEARYNQGFEEADLGTDESGI